MERARALLTGISIGAGWTYFFDPQSGKRRRSLLRDQCLSSLRHANRWLEKAVRDLRHRAEGSLAEATGMLNLRAPGEAKLVERVRARLGHVASHPRLIEVDARDGCITLRGHAPAAEIGRIATSISTLRGVHDLDNQLDDEIGPDIAQHNGRSRVAPPLDILRENWAPGTRLALGAIGGALMVNCALRRTPGAILLGTLGFGLCARAVSNRNMASILEGGGNMARPLLDRLPMRSQRLRTAHAG